MWKAYQPSETFKRTLLPHLKLPEKQDDLRTWFENEATIIRRVGWDEKRGRSIGFMRCENLELCIKQYGTGTSAGLFRNLLSYIRCRGGKKKYRRHKKLFDWGVSVPEPYVCLYDYDKKRRDLSAYVVVQKLDDAHTLMEYWENTQITTAEKLRIFEDLASVIANLHLQGYAHDDLHWANIMLSGDKIFLIDLDRVRPSFTRPFYGGRTSLDVAKFIMNAPFKTSEDTEEIDDAVSLFLQRYCELRGMDRSTLMAKVYRSLNYLTRRYAKRGLEHRVLEIKLVRNKLRLLET